MQFENLTENGFATLTEQAFSDMQESAIAAIQTSIDALSAAVATLAESATALRDDLATVQTSVNSIPTTTYTIPTAYEIASAVWSDSNRTLTTTSFPSVSEIQSGLATSNEISYLQSAVNSIPTTTYDVPSAYDIASAVWGCTTRNLTPDSAFRAALAEEVWDHATRTLTASPMDISDLATAVAVADIQTAVNLIPTTTYDIPTVAEIQSGLAKTSELPDISTLATSAEVANVKSVLDLLFALVGKWSVSGDTLTTYDTLGEPLGTYTLTRDETGKITGVA